MTQKSDQPTVLSDAEISDAHGGVGMLLPAVQQAREAARPQRNQLGNFEIQVLMSRFNQAETLEPSVQKKDDDTANAVIGKIG